MITDTRKQALARIARMENTPVVTHKATVQANAIRHAIDAADKYLELIQHAGRCRAAGQIELADQADRTAAEWKATRMSALAVRIAESD